MQIAESGIEKNPSESLNDSYHLFEHIQYLELKRKLVHEEFVEDEDPSSRELKRKRINPGVRIKRK